MSLHEANTTLKSKLTCVPHFQFYIKKKKSYSHIIVIITPHIYVAHSSLFL